MGKSTLNFPKTIVLVGKTGNGKSATANSIVGAEVFKSEHSFSGVTATCQMYASVVAGGQILNVIDTPGLFDSSIDPKTIGNEIAKCINLAKGGIHAVVVVVSLGCRFSMDEASAIQSLSRFFGGKFGDYMILVFTHGDCLGNKSFDDFLASNCPEPLAKTLELCGNRHVVFDNRTDDQVEKSQQLIKLVDLVDTVVHNNGGAPYTNELFVDESESDNAGLNGFLEKTALMLEKQLAEERIARMEAEAKAKDGQIKSAYEMSELKLDLERARRDAAELQKSRAEMENKFKETEEKFKETEEKLKETENKLNQKWGCVIS